VEQPRWGFLAASWYWLNAGPRPGQINDFADSGDILAVSRCVNGWVEGRMPNGWDDRLARWNRCLAMGDDILPGSGLLIPGVEGLFA
jgi:predicted chitinase